MVGRWQIIILLGLFNLLAMDKFTKHGHSKSEPAGEYGALIEMEPILSAKKHEPFMPVVPEIDLEKGESSNSSEVVPLNENKELAQKVEQIIGDLHTLKDQLEPEPIFVPVTLKEKIKYYCYRTKQWVCEHKGRVTLVIVGGVLCVYFGYYIGVRGIQKMTDTCDRARDKAEDVIDLVDQALPFCKHTLAQCKESGAQCDRANVMFATLLTMLKNGTCELARGFTQEAIVAFGEMLDVCRRATDFGYHPQ
ncbi:TPA: hypothetical protein DIC20_03160 [Candidatus Dependentiae bacterium]|nr:hypothetical protein [Candidatus Dependentiae bacterium]HCU00675.1 hypothetical protein [Candidatus Dependentiae bacterium]